jgi:hypothetical protein
MWRNTRNTPWTVAACTLALASVAAQEREHPLPPILRGRVVAVGVPGASAIEPSSPKKYVT